MRPWTFTWFFLCVSSHALAHGDLHEQIEGLTKRLQRDPANAELFHKRGELYRAHQDYKAALADYDRAEHLDPALAVVHLSRGRSLLEIGRPAEAIRTLSVFLARRMGHAEALLLRARAYERLAERDKAERDFAAALEATVEPSPDMVLERAANLDAAGRAREALTLLEAALQRVGPVVSLEQAAVELGVKLAQYDAALVRIDGMLARVARKAALLAQRATVLERAGRIAEAQATRQQALVAIEALPVAKRKLAASEELERDLRLALSR